MEARTPSAGQKSKHLNNVIFISDSVTLTAQPSLTSTFRSHLSPKGSL